MNVAVILAGGSGSRLGVSMPKQFLKIAGKMVIEHTISAFEQNAGIDEIVIVTNPYYLYLVETMVLKNEWKKTKKILNGGNERYKSSLTAITSYNNDETNLIFHDAVRPLISQRIIDDVIQALETYNAVDVAIPSADTIITVEDNQIKNIPDRSTLMRGQTPQGFKLKTIKRAYELALQDADLKTTDDCSIVKKYLPDETVFVVNGEDCNMKLTYKEDLFLLDKLFQLRSISLNGSTFLEELKDKVIVVFGGSSGIGKDIVEVSRLYGAKAYPFSRSLNDVDISNIDSVNKAFEDVFSENKRIDYVVNSAAILLKEPLVSMDKDAINEIININYFGMINVSVASYPYLKESQGSLLHFTSSSYTRGREFYSLYSSTKAAVVNFVQAIAQEWDPFKIRINCINPERTKTPMRERNFGLEPEDTLLDSISVSKVALEALMSGFSGQVIDVKK
ncbi:MAG: 2-C-methyl-D-erythritol 4-phosphate cytidylyltransferase [Segetibacter sp.]|nr:2-C-methyl-D-erythritol 4-phosphate cytidylyltransferase [Segetibacter sp.]